MALSPAPPPPYTASKEPAQQRGTYVCVLCEFPLPAEQGDTMPDCPNCGETQFRAASMFQPAFSPRDDLAEDHDWLDEARSSLPPGSAPRLTFREEEVVHVLPLHGSLTRIGRSPAAQVLLDDPTVSRRHAMIAYDNGVLTVFDDRSLNGVYVNGERVEQSTLTDGDEVVIGCVHLYVIVP